MLSCLLSSFLFLPKLDAHSLQIPHSLQIEDFYTLHLLNRIPNWGKTFQILAIPLNWTLQFAHTLQLTHEKNTLFILPDHSESNLVIANLFGAHSPCFLTIETSTYLVALLPNLENKLSWEREGYNVSPNWTVYWFVSFPNWCS
jgi:hypothetical protein